MPKGVEHCSVSFTHSFPDVVIPYLMPKGVEHGFKQKLEERIAQVIPYLMPKGVEHLRFGMPMRYFPGDSISDAERR